MYICVYHDTKAIQRSDPGSLWSAGPAHDQLRTFWAFTTRHPDQATAALRRQSARTGSDESAAIDLVHPLFSPWAGMTQLTPSTRETGKRASPLGLGFIQSGSLTKALQIYGLSGHLILIHHQSASDCCPDNRSDSLSHPNLSIRLINPPQYPSIIKNIRIQLCPFTFSIRSCCWP